jgi:ribosomal protein S12 methylthiotransferase accessory factor
VTLRAAYGNGTQRLVAPEETLERVRAAAAACGVTRCADVTHLDTLGIPVFCAIRPTATVLQVSNGKGLTREGARVSAIMEGIELYHAETPEDGRLLWASERELGQEQRRHLAPADVHGFEVDRHYSPGLRIEWCPGRDLATGADVLVPASAVFFNRSPSLHFTSTNGLASGNHHVEATLHALYELVERDAAATLQSGDRVPIRGYCRIVDPAGIPDGALAEAVRRVAAAGSHLRLLHVPSRIPAHTFWAVLMNEESFISGTSFNTGWGTHLDLEIAAARAITEAAQSRATMIHGSREDCSSKPVFRDGVSVTGSRAFGFFRDLVPDTSWPGLRELGIDADDDLERNLERIVDAIDQAGLGPLVECDLTQRDVGVPIVKVLAPALRFRYR